MTTSLFPAERLDWGRHYLMCPPDYFGVVYSINPWMDPTVTVDVDRAREQWDRLVRTLQGTGARIEQIAPVSGLPDMVFTANAGLVEGTRFAPARMRHPERRAEAAHFSGWFAARGHQIVDHGDAMVQEGAGDALPFNGTLVTGYGQRSTGAGWQMLGVRADVEVRSVRLVDPRYYHVDIAFCPLDGRSALFAPEAFDAAGRRTIEELVPEPVPLTPAETALFCANSLVIDRTIIMPACTPRLGRLLERRGFDVVVVHVGEFLKAGGGCRCLTLALDTVLMSTAVPVAS